MTTEHDMSPRHSTTPRAKMRIHSKDSPGSLELLPLSPESSSLFLNKSMFAPLRKKINATSKVNSQVQKAAQWLSVTGQTLAENLTARNPSTREAEPGGVWG